MAKNNIYTWKSWALGFNVYDKVWREFLSIREFKKQSP